MSPEPYLTSSQDPQQGLGSAEPPSASASLSPEQHAREKKMQSLHSSISTLHTQTADLEAQISDIKGKLRNDPSTTVKKHIRLLHEYNEIKDIGQGLMGLIADARNVRQIEVQREFGVGDRD